MPGIILNCLSELGNLMKSWMRSSRPAIPSYLPAEATIRSLNALIEKGRTYFRNEDLQSALDSWRRALLVDPDNERAQAYAARAERQLENLERLRSEPDVSGGVR